VTIAATRATYPSDATRAARLRRQRARCARHLAALEFAHRLAQLVATAPDDETRREMNRLILRVRLRGCAADEERRAGVTAALRKWAALTLSEITEETGLSREDARRTLDQLIESRAVAAFTRDGRGQKAIYFRLT
jgi:predicted HTH transcriptional regulator